MNAAPEPTGGIPGRTWKAGTSSLTLDRTDPGDLYVCAWIGERPAGTSALFTSPQLREIAAELLERAEALDNTASRNRKTPAWHMREGQRRLSSAAHFLTAPLVGDHLRLAEVNAAVASAHFTAAMAARALTTVHITHNQSGKDHE